MGRQVQRIAVVPLACENDAERAVAFGISELVADAIDGRLGVDVRARGARLASRSERPLAAIGAELDVPLVVGGRLAADGAQLALVNARDGFVLWSRSFPTATRDPFGVAFDAARDIAAALLVPPEAPSAPPPSSARTVELLLRARYEASRPSTDGDDRVVSLLERAFSRDPADPWVNAAYSLALAQRLAETEFPGDADEALAMARTAVEHAPRLAMAHHALAEVLVVHGDLVASARSAALAHTLAPGNPAVQRLVAHLLLEAGAVDASVTLLQSASARDETPWRAVWDEARAMIARGRWQDADERLDAALDVEHLAAGPWLGRVRCALFRQDLLRCDTLRMQLGEAVACDKEAILAALDAVLGRASLASALERIESAARNASCSRPRADALRQLAVDVAGTTGQHARVAVLLGGLSERGLVDLTWLDLSPTLAGVRATPAFIAAHDAAGTRARAIRVALEGPHETVEGGFT